MMSIKLRFHSNMQNTMLLLLFVFKVDGVSGPETDISVMEGDSVTLHTDLTELLNDHTILWSFGPKRSVISHITREKDHTSFSVTDDEGFRGRLQVDPITGSLTIRNTRIRHAGHYQLTISRGGTIPTSKTFNLTVQRVISGTGGVKSQSVSVMEGESVTLDPDESLIQGDDLMLWRFGDKDILLATLDAETNEISLYDAEERFRDRLKLDPQTGSLTIRNSRTTDSGLYYLQIRGRESLQLFILTVNRTGLSPGAVAAIVINVLILAVVAGRLIYHRRKISELRKQLWSTKMSQEHVSLGKIRFCGSVFTGKDITLKPNIKINKDDEIQWVFGEGKQRTVIAKISGEPRRIYTYDDVADERFRGRLKLDETTGDLTIRNSRTTHSGPYTVQIRDRSGASDQIFFVTVNGSAITGEDITRSNEKMTFEGDNLLRSTRTEHSGPCMLYDIESRSVNENVEEKPVEEGDSVTLKPDSEKQRYDLMLWMFGDQDSLIAYIRAGTGETCDDERFRDRLELDETTGSLTIRNILLQHTGLYKLRTIRSSGGILIKKFRVFIQNSSVKPENESETVEMSLLGEKVPDAVNEQERRRSL